MILWRGMDQKRERTIRRALYGIPRSALLTVPPGFRESARREVERILADPWHRDLVPAPVEDDGPHLIVRSADLLAIFEILFRSSSLQDVRLVIAEGRVTATRGTGALCREADWSLYLPSPSRVSVTVRTSESRASHKRGIRDEIARVLGRFGIEIVEEADLRLFADVRRNHMRISLSLAGEPLYRRGYRERLNTAAPLREDLARCALDEGLLFAARQGSAPMRLSVPFAGSGTFLFEYLIRTADIPPCLFPRNYAADTLPFARQASLSWLRRRAVREVRPLPGLRILAGDAAPDAVRGLQANWERFRGILAGTPLFGGGSAAPPPEEPGTAESGTAETGKETGPVVSFDVQDFFAVPASALIPSGSGDLFLPLNPPYGIRLAGEETPARYEKIGSAVMRIAGELGRIGTGFAGLVLCPDEASWKAFLLRTEGLVRETRHLSQGGLDIRLCLFACPAGSCGGSGESERS